MSSLAEPYTADEFDILNDIGLISALFKNTIYKYCLDITGGDPLLHPELAKILQNLPKCNPNELRSLTTNALVFPSLSDETIEAMKSISVNVSDYGINHAAVEKTKQICMDNSIMLTVNYRNVFEVARFSQCGGMGSINRVDCNVDRRCICSVVRNGKFYPCAENFHVGKLKSGLPGFYVNLDQIETAGQAVLLMVLQQPLCRHCLVKERHVVRWTNGQNSLDTYLDKHI
jgi:hypothetical protein